MGNDTGFVPWFVSGAPALWAGFFLVAAWYIRTRPIWKQKVTEAAAGAEAITASQFGRLQTEITRMALRIENLENQCEELHKEHMACLEREAHERSGRLEAEAMLVGKGNIDQEVQRRLSAERQKDAKK